MDKLVREKMLELFQSTHPVRGATVAAALFGLARGISIHAPPAGGGPRHRGNRGGGGIISIHAPRAGCDT